MNENKERWGVFAWSRMKDGHTVARIDNCFETENEAWMAMQGPDFSGYDSRVICAEKDFDECMRLIGATVNGR